MSLENQNPFEDMYKAADGDTEITEKALAEVKKNEILESMQKKAPRMITSKTKTKTATSSPEMDEWTKRHEDGQEKYARKFEGQPGPDKS